MRDLHEMSFGHRVMLTVAIVIIILIVLAAFGYLTGRWEEAQAKVTYDCVDPTERERVREIALVGIDEGLKQAMVHLYEVWQKDPSTAQPQRAQVGTTNAINAHSRGRKLAMAWNPPNCPPESSPKEN
jgi:hypothetical protein